jgi:FkbM family methyltransferase
MTSSNEGGHAPAPFVRGLRLPGPQGNVADQIGERDFGFFEMHFAGAKPITMLSLGDCQVVRALLKSGISGFEPFSLGLWTALAKQSRLVVDIGAYTGIYSLIAAAANPNIRVVAFEPSPTTFGRLITNIIANRADARIAPVNFGASSRSGHLDLLLHGGVYVMSSGESLEQSIHSRAWATKRVQTVSADEILIDWKLFYPSDLTLSLDNHSVVDLIKIDVEGHEESTLEGLKRVIARDKPTMFIEILEESKLPKILQTLKDYDACWIDERGSLSRERVPGALNTLFIHRERRDHFTALAADSLAKFPD